VPTQDEAGVKVLFEKNPAALKLGKQVPT